MSVVACRINDLKGGSGYEVEMAYTSNRLSIFIKG